MQLNDENSKFIKGQKQQTVQMIKQQDDNLVVLGSAVDRVGEMAKTINTEVKEQSIMLDGLDQDINDASSRLNTVQEALGKLLKTKDGCQIWTIVILTAILMLLSKYLFAACVFGLKFQLYCYLLSVFIIYFDTIIQLIVFFYYLKLLW